LTVNHIQYSTQGKKEEMKVLVINAGSSSMKFTLFSMANNTVLAKGQFERLGTDKPNMIYKRLSDGLKFEGIVPVRNLEEALKRVCAKLVDPADGVMKDLGEIVAIGHRVLLGGEKITIRVLSSTAGPMTLKDAGVSGENLKIMQSAIRMPSGMILMCGPTGSGKTSTLYAMLQAIDYSMKNVISIEDPIEHVMENISQMEVNTKADITFAKLLRNALRQNPDIICLGEIRDEETAQVSAHAAQTGHLIIATVHSNDNLGTIDRLVNLGIPLRSADRPELTPLVIAGGTACSNPEPMAPFFDLMIIGEGEEVNNEVLALFRQAQQAGWSKTRFLETAAKIQGVLIPSFYVPHWNPDGTLHDLTPTHGVPARVTKRIIQDLDACYYPTDPIVPSTEIVHDRVNVELFRGCIRGCRFMPLLRHAMSALFAHC